MKKYRLTLTVANQYLAKLDEATLAAVFGNVGSLLAFQVGAQDAEVLAEQLGGDLLNDKSGVNGAEVFYPSSGLWFPDALPDPEPEVGMEALRKIETSR